MYDPFEDAEKRGEAAGEDRFAALLTKLKSMGRNDDADRVLTDKQYRKELMKELAIQETSNLPPALAGIFLYGFLSHSVAPHRDHVAASVKVWQLPQHRGNYNFMDHATAIYLRTLPHKYMLS